MSEAVHVEIHLRMLDCQICGSEINPDREEYIGRKRVCRRCFDHLALRKRKRQK